MGTGTTNYSNFERNDSSNSVDLYLKEIKGGVSKTSYWVKNVRKNEVSFSRFSSGRSSIVVVNNTTTTVIRQMTKREWEGTEEDGVEPIKIGEDEGTQQLKTETWPRKKTKFYKNIKEIAVLCVCENNGGMMEPSSS